eukprot:Amastigsp_a510585_31.p4 type:complete len:144 gc:universal Amastigsp_a510585_31:1095-664(-)
MPALARDIERGLSCIVRSLGVGAHLGQKTSHVQRALVHRGDERSVTAVCATLKIRACSRSQKLNNIEVPARAREIQRRVPALSNDAETNAELFREEFDDRETPGVARQADGRVTQSRGCALYVSTPSDEGTNNIDVAGDGSGE